jgi:hypothetical protein
LLVKAGLIGCGNAIQGARGGVNIPDTDIPGVKSHLQKHYAEFDMKAPWEPQAAIDDTVIKGDEAEAWSWTKAPEEGDMTKEQVEGFEKRITELEAAMKAGRVLSQANEKDLSKANDLTDQAGELIEGVLDQVGGTYNEPAEPDANAPALPETGTPAPPKTPPKEAETIEVKELTIGEVKDDDEIEIDVDTLLTVINEETKEPDDDEIVEVSETDLLAVINEGSTEEV